MRFIIRVDASPSIGIGHAMRCATLAAALRAADHDVMIVSVGLPSFVHDRLEALGAGIFPTADTRRDSVARLVTELTPSVCIIDGYHLADEARELAAAGVVLAMIDDNRELPVEHATIVVNQNLHARELDYPTDDSIIWLLGPRYALIRPDVVALLRDEPDDTSAREVMVSIGGTDPLGLTLPIVEHLMKRPDERAVVSLSEQHPDHVALLELVDRFPARLRRAGPDMVDAFEAAGIAVIGGGSTLWEVGYLGIPAVVAVVADNQIGGAFAAHAAGTVMAVDCRDGQGPGLTRLLEQIDRLLRRPEAGRLMSQRGRELFDGRGASRVAEALQAAASVAADPSCDLGPSGQ